MSAREKKELVALARMPDFAIDTGDIPEVGDWTATWTGRFYRSLAKRRNQL